MPFLPYLDVVTSKEPFSRIGAGTRTCVDAVTRIGGHRPGVTVLFLAIFRSV